MDQLRPILNELKQTLSDDIEMISSIDTHVLFLNCSIEKSKGYFSTRVYHDTTIQQFVLPYFSGHPRLIYRQWYRFMMTRAVRYCHDLEDFQDERRYIEATFLSNGYS